MQTVEAIIDEKGKVHLLEAINLKNIQRVLITILPNETKTSEINKVDITHLGKILNDDLETASWEISQSFIAAIENSSHQLEIN